MGGRVHSGAFGCVRIKLQVQTQFKLFYTVAKIIIHAD